MTKHRSYKFDKLIKVADDVLLREYFRRKGYSIPADQKITPDYVSELIDNIEDEDASLDLEEVNDIADKAVDRLGEIIEQFDIKCDEEESPRNHCIKNLPPRK